MSIFTFLLQRLKHHWMMLITFILGVILSTAFLASGPILVDALLEYGLRRVLIRANEQADIFHLHTWESITYEESIALNDDLTEFLTGQFDPLVVRLVPAGRVGFIYPWQDEELAIDRRLTLGFYGSSNEELLEHVEVLQSVSPEDIVESSDIIPVQIGFLMAQQWGIKAGDLIPVSISAKASSPEFSLLVSSIISPKSFQDTYWLDHFNPFQSIESTQKDAFFGVFVDRTEFFDLTAVLFPEREIRHMWLGNLGLGQIEFENIEKTQQTLAQLNEDLKIINEEMRANSDLLSILENYSSQTNIARAPLYFLIGIVILVALYYLVMISSLYLEQVRGEFSILRSRGSSVIKLFNIGISEGLLFSLIAVLVGPLLGWIAVRLLAAFGPLAAIAEPDWGLTLPQAAWLSAGIAALASASSFLLPLPGVLKTSITTHKRRQVRSGRPPWWQRTYLDVFVLLIGMVLLFRLELYGSLIGGTRENPQLDIMLILGPLSLLLGTAAVFLRLFPLFLNKATDLANRGRGLPFVLALSQAARDPAHVTRLVLLLMLTMSLGIFSSSLDATMTRNEVDRSDYFTGGDIRLITNPELLQVQSITGIEAQSWIWRSEAALLAGEPTPGLDILAVDPENFSALSSFRSDFSDQPTELLLKNLQTEWVENRIPLPVEALPGEPSQIGLWLGLPFSLREHPERVDMLSRTQFEIRLLTANGEFIIAEVKPAYIPEDTNEAWSYFEGDVPALNPEGYPLRMVSFWLQSSGLELGDFEPLWIDDLSVIDHITGETTVIESFEAVEFPGWNSLTQPVRSFVNQSFARSGTSGLALYFDRIGISPLRWYGIHSIDDFALQAIPALVSPDFLAMTNLEIGEEIRIKVNVPGNIEWDRMTFKILGTVNYFPTMYEAQEAGFLVTLREPLLEQVNLYRYFPALSNEVLLQTSDPAIVSDSLMRSGYLQEDFYAAQSMLTELRSNPLAIGLRSVTQFGYILTAVLSLVGFASHFYFSTKQRAGNYSILRAIGFSPRQLYLTLLVEQLVLIVSGLSLGTVLGILLNQLTLPGLPLRLGTLDTIPPFIVEIDWRLIIQVYLTMALAFLASIGISISFLWRMKIHRVLRVGEE